VISVLGAFDRVCLHALSDFLSPLTKSCNLADVNLNWDHNNNKFTNYKHNAPNVFNDVVATRPPCETFTPPSLRTQAPERIERYFEHCTS